MLSEDEAGDKWGHYNAECTSLLRGRRWRRLGSWISDETTTCSSVTATNQLSSHQDPGRVRFVSAPSKRLTAPRVGSGTSSGQESRAPRGPALQFTASASNREMHLKPPTSTPRTPDKATRRFMGVSHFKEMVITAPLE